MAAQSNEREIDKNLVFLNLEKKIGITFNILFIDETRYIILIIDKEFFS